ncbi:MAG: hypothetical protein ACREQW_04970 [Candidatus Binatia bacterium]
MQAVYDLVGYRTADDRPESIKADARNWILSDHCSPGSFVWVCHHLELDPEAVRRHVLTTQPHPRRSGSAKDRIHTERRYSLPAEGEDSAHRSSDYTVTVQPDPLAASSPLCIESTSLQPAFIVPSI